MGRGSRQVVCSERNGRTLFAPTHICTNYKKIRKKIKNVEVQKSGVSDFCKTKNAPIWVLSLTNNKKYVLSREPP